MTFLNLLKLCLLILLLSLVSACSTWKTQESKSPVDLGETQFKKILYQQWHEWKSVRYRLGGLSKTGVDCSGFVFLTFRDKFGRYLPKTSIQQAHSGKTITQRNLRAGDLVFFVTGRRQRHVGIYVENRKFLHASSSKGVTFSSLDSSYWANKYWKSVRVLDI